MRPSLSNSRSSNNSYTSDDGWWMVHSTPWPSLASSFMHFITSSAVKLSSPVVGSSMAMSGGDVTSSMPTLTRFFSPPLMPRTRGPPITVSAHFSICDRGRCCCCCLLGGAGTGLV